MIMQNSELPIERQEIQMPATRLAIELASSSINLADYMTSDGGLNDLMLAEVNYLCIVASIEETSKTARQNTFNYCLDHLKELFEQEEYIQAINTTFLT